MGANLSALRPYRLPAKIENEQQIYDFYAANYNSLLWQALKTRKGPVTKAYEAFCNRVGESGKFQYFGTDPASFDEFQQNIREGMQEYQGAIRNPHSTPEEKRSAYKKFFNSPATEANNAILAENPRPVADTESKPATVEGGLPRALVISFLKKQLAELPKPESTDPFLLPTTPSTDYTLDQAISAVEQTWNVTISKQLSLWGWWHGFDKLNIAPANSTTAMSIKPATAWVARNYMGPSMTIPVSAHDTVVLTGASHKMIHELTHSVQFMFHPFWKWPAEIVEVPTMAIERKYNSEFDDWTKRRQAALSLADLTSKDAQDFNSIFEKESGFKNVGNVSAKMWQYYGQPRRYHSYILGMCYPVPKAGNYPSSGTDDGRCPNIVKNPNDSFWTQKQPNIVQNPDSLYWSIVKWLEAGK